MKYIDYWFRKLVRFSKVLCDTYLLLTADDSKSYVHMILNCSEFLNS